MIAERRVFRLSLRQRLPLLFCFVPMVAALAISYGLASLLVLAISEAVVVGLTSRFGVTLTADGITVEGLRSRFVPWPAITDVRAEQMLSTHYLVLVRTGRKMRLRAPVTGLMQQDPDFEDKVAEIVSWWRAHRNPADPTGAGPVED